jgi:hypothetical protein
MSQYIDCSIKWSLVENSYGVTMQAEHDQLRRKLAEHSE